MKKSPELRRPAEFVALIAIFLNLIVTAIPQLNAAEIANLIAQLQLQVVSQNETGAEIAAQYQEGPSNQPPVERIYGAINASNNCVEIDEKSFKPGPHLKVTSFGLHGNTLYWQVEAEYNIITAGKLFSFSITEKPDQENCQIPPGESGQISISVTAGQLATNGEGNPPIETTGTQINMVNPLSINAESQNLDIGQNGTVEVEKTNFDILLKATGLAPHTTYYLEFTYPNGTKESLQVVSDENGKFNLCIIEGTQYTEYAPMVLQR